MHSENIHNLYSTVYKLLLWLLNRRSCSEHNITEYTESGEFHEKFQS